MKESENVVTDQHLAIAMRARTDADRGNPQPRSHDLRDRIGNTLNYQREDASVFQRKRVRDQFLRRFITASLLTHASQLMHVLRGQPDMPHNGETRRRESPNGLRNGASALQLHGSSASFLEEPCRVLHGLLGR